MFQSPRRCGAREGVSRGTAAAPPRTGQAIPESVDKSRVDPEIAGTGSTRLRVGSRVPRQGTDALLYQNAIDVASSGTAVSGYPL